MSSINNLTATTQEPDYQATADELSIDTGDHDIFSSLDDLVVEDGAPQGEGRQDEDVADGYVDDATEEGEEEYGEYESEYDEFDFEDIIDDDLPEEQRQKDQKDDEEYARELEDEEEYEEDDEYDEDDEDDYEEDEDEYEDDDEEYEYEEEVEGDIVEDEVDYESYEVTLPTGESVTLQEAIEGYRSNEIVQQEKEDFEIAKGAFKQEAGNTIGYLKLARLEADRVIDDYTNFDWAELSRKDPQAYVENREFLDKYKARKQEIVVAMGELQEEEQETQRADFNQRARTCLSTLKAEVPGWNDSLYQELMQYAIDGGAAESDIADCIDPSIFKMLNKARQFDLGKQIVKAKIKRRVGSPRKVAKSGARSTKSHVSNRDKIARKLEAGITGDSDIFNALED
jgi:hypothetical protein